MRFRIICSALISGVVGGLVAECAAIGQENPALFGGDKPLMAEPTGSLTLQQALALALLRNPELAAFSYEVRATEARMLQAQLRPNPELEMELGEYGRDGEGFDSAETSVSLGQVFELGGKRHWRTRMAQAQGELAGWDYESKRLDVLTSAARRFAAVLAAQRRLELAQFFVELAEKTSHAVVERVKAGKEPPFQATKAEAELEMARLRVSEAQNGLALARKKLATMWGSVHPKFQTVQGELDRILGSVPPIESFRSQLPRTPELARRESEIRLREARLASEKAARFPDLQASVGFARFQEDDTTAFSVGIGLPLPLFDRNQGNIAAAKHDVAKARAEGLAVETARVAELAEAHADLVLTHQRVLTFRSKVVPAMEEAFEAAHEGYRQGKFTFLDMLDAQRGLFEAKGALVDALADYHAAVATLQRIAGTSFDGLTKPKEEKSR